MFTDLLEDVIFADFLVSAVPDVDPAKVLEVCRGLMDSDEGVTCSNGPETWHSTLSREIPDDALGECIRQCIGFADWYVRDRYNVTISGDQDWWVNSTKFGGYNTPHTHGKADLIGIYYPKVPTDSSELCILRNDGSTYHNIFINERKLMVKPVEGRFYIFPGHLWHYVDVHTIEEERVSISFNLSTSPI